MIHLVDLTDIQPDVGVHAFRQQRRESDGNRIVLSPVYLDHRDNEVSSAGQLDFIDESLGESYGCAIVSCFGVTVFVETFELADRRVNNHFRKTVPWHAYRMDGRGRAHANSCQS